MKSDSPSETWVAVVADDAIAVALSAGLNSQKVRVRRFAVCTELMHCSNLDAPQAIVLGLSLLPLTGVAAGREWPAGWDVPVVAVGPLPAGQAAEQALEQAGWLADSGVHHWLPNLDGAEWPLSLAFARAVHGREQAQRQQLAGLQAQLTEARWVGRAKGLLMAAQGMTEPEAFALLRSGAMHTRLPLAEMARAVVDAALWADAVNRAGQLRWLSQRCVAAAAQRLARIEPPAARRRQQEALTRASDILAALARLPLPEAAPAAASAETPAAEPVREALALADTAWRALRACLDQRLTLATLTDADTLAEAALTQAEALTSRLQAVGSSPMLRVVNLCGRQRMRAQRLVKLGLLAHLGRPAADAGEASALLESFAATLQELALLPLGSPEIAAAHALAVQRWRDMTLALQTGEAAALVHEGEALLEAVDALTHCWERSLQFLLG